MVNNSPLNPDVALEKILSTTPRLEPETIQLEHALGRVLAEDVFAEDSLPPFDNSAMDGYALIAADTIGASKEAPAVLKVIAEAPAGTMIDEDVTPGTAVRIMTGAPVPRGANAVVMVEDTARQGTEALIFREARLNANIRPAGEDVMRGDLVLKSGTRIRPSEMGMLAALGKQSVQVFRKPRVAIVTSGSELVDVSQKPEKGQIRDSNSYSMLGQVLSAGAEVSMTARVVDERDELERTLSSAAAISDLIVVCGGVSVGDYDFVKETLAKLGKMLFWKVFIKPGKPVVYGHIEGIPLFGLPGNPVSSMVTFDLFVRPAIFTMMGQEASPWKTVTGVITQEIRHNPCLREFVRASTKWDDGSYTASPTGRQGSGRLSTMLQANSYIVIREGIADVSAGDLVEIMLFE